MQRVDGRYQVYGNPITRGQSNAADRWQRMFVRKFGHDPNERYHLRGGGQPVPRARSSACATSCGSRPPREATDLATLSDDGVLISTIRMGFGHYRIAMAGASAARAMGFTPYWLDLLGIPGSPAR
jgi:hypothetical protein